MADTKKMNPRDRHFVETKENPSGSPFGKYSLLNQVIKGIDKLTGYDRGKNKPTEKEYYGQLPKSKKYQKPRKVQGLDKTT